METRTGMIFSGHDLLPLRVSCLSRFHHKHFRVVSNRATRARLATMGQDRKIGGIHSCPGGICPGGIHACPVFRSPFHPI